MIKCCKQNKNIYFTLAKLYYYHDHANSNKYANNMEALVLSIQK